METKVVHYPKLGIFKAFFKSPKAYHWGTFRDIKGQYLEFKEAEQAIDYCEQQMGAAKERDNAVTIWQSVPEKNL